MRGVEVSLLAAGSLTGGGDIRKRARKLKALVVMLKRICILWPASEVKYRRKEIVISS